MEWCSLSSLYLLYLSHIRHNSCRYLWIMMIPWRDKILKQTKMLIDIMFINFQSGHDVQSLLTFVLLFFSCVLRLFIFTSWLSSCWRYDKIPSRPLEFEFESVFAIFFVFVCGLGLNCNYMKGGGSLLLACCIAIEHVNEHTWNLNDEVVQLITLLI